MPRVHQFVTTWEPGAIGTHARIVHEQLNESGVECTTWASDQRDGMPFAVRDASTFASMPVRSDAVLLYHLAVGAPLGDELLRRPEPLVLAYHNVTPARFFDAWHPALAENVEVGLAQVERLARHARAAITESNFNADHLRGFGCARVEVIPLPMVARKPIDRVLEASLRDRPGTAWLFVGRCAPNKAQMQLVRAFAWYRAAFDAAAQLWLVGVGPSDAYSNAVERLIERLDLSDSVRVMGAVSEEMLGACYAAADVYVSLSRHEGFGVPLIEAMAHDLPVVALGVTAVPETVADAGVVIDRDEPGFVAAAAARVIGDQSLRGSIVAAGRTRVATVCGDGVDQRWTDALRSLVDELTLAPVQSVR